MTQRNIRATLLCLLCLFCLIPAVLTGCGRASAADNNEVTKVIPDGRGNIRVEAVLTQSTLDGYSGKNVYLFEVPSAYTTDVDLRDLDPVAEAKPEGKMTFKCPAYDGVRSRLYSSYLIASYDASSRTYTALTSPRAVGDFSRMQTASFEEDGEISIKGLISDHPGDADRLGVAHTIVDVYMDELILKKWQEGAVSYVWNGLTAYVDGGVLEELDERVRAYTSADIRVYLRFLLRAPQEGSNTPSCLYMPTADMPTYEVYRAVNMGDDQTVEIMKGFFDFMADRYASPEDGARPVTSFILGYRVNHAAVYNYAGNISLEEYVRNYEKLVRVANTAMKSHLSNGRVYISLDAHRTMGGMTGEGWDVPSFLSAFHSECDLLGNFDWQVACELYADTPNIWLEDAEKDAQYYTVHSLGTLTDLLVSDKYRTSSGKERKVLISSLTIPTAAGDDLPTEEGNAMQAASYAYAYMTCVQNGYVEALIYGAYADTAEPGGGCGLWTVTDSDGQSVISEKRPLYDIFKKIDTSDAASLSESLTAIMDEPFTRLELALSGKAASVTTVTGETALIGYQSDRLKTTPVLLFNDGSLQGFEGMENLTYLELAGAESLGTANLYARFDRDAICDPMGITTTLSASDLLEGKKLLLDLYAGEIGNSLALPSVSLRLVRPAKGLVSEGDGEIIYEASVSNVKSGVWQTAEFDVSAFVTLLDDSDEVTLTVFLDYGDDGELHSANHMGIVGIHTSGKIPAAQGSHGLVIGIVITLSVVLIGGFLVLFLNRRGRR